MDCRKGCGACCIAPSISSPIPGMPQGKAAGQKCIHLTEDYLCGLFGKPERPKVCDQFDAHLDTCGRNREEAIWLLTTLERETS